MPLLEHESMKELIAIEEQQLERCVLKEWRSSATGSGWKSVSWELNEISYGISMNKRHPDMNTGHCSVMVRYFKRGELHRVGGPAESDGVNDVYAVNGKEMFLNEFNFWTGNK